VILANGQIYPSDRQDELLERLNDQILATLSEKRLPTERVIDAIDRLGRQVQAGVFDDLIASLPVDGVEQYKQLAIQLLSRDYLEFKIRTELGGDFSPDRVSEPPFGLTRLRIQARPLGVLLHIAAGNVDGLPAFSLAEGLLTGNINILKLPQADNDLSVTVIRALIQLEPALADFIYVFDTPSTDVAAIKKMADLSDGIAVWGGDTAVAAVRQFAAPGTKIIEWGHKLSFAYIAGYADKDAELTALAKHVMTTRQLLCSSCQVIYLDTDDADAPAAFCREFLPYLERAAAAHRPTTIDAVAEQTLRRYVERLESFLTGGPPKDDFRGQGCSLTPCADSELELSDMFGNVLVKRLPRRELIRVLRRQKGYLQTAGLICPPDQRRLLSDLLARAGVVRITGAGTMSAAFAGEAHDGEYPLRRYLRMVDEEVVPRRVRPIRQKNT
jgi:hypothetical protein